MVLVPYRINTNLDFVPRVVVKSSGQEFTQLKINSVNATWCKIYSCIFKKTLYGAFCTPLADFDN
ncbi:hypothetical protein BpHYR1_054082 [Brachionus plicatilis]|uniref:Uncharacterized protein n=1 Tax=Brachionus plicatilis TaxID=10195 RepID=A0A3M7PN34_BRAPC|nr:hypothetical protein BpHYR1_054082 [Brachionus plicatilis]